MNDMNREIKFRLWQNGKMKDNPKTVCACAVNDIFSDGDGVFMQFTGLKDKNGKEIYEGDIVGGYPHGTVKVGWNEAYAAFDAIWLEADFDEEGDTILKEVSSSFANEFYNCNDAWAVIGNIYENPELLTPPPHDTKG